MEELKLKIGAKDIKLRSEISDYFEVVSYFSLVKDDINKYLMRIYNGEYAFLFSSLKLKIDKVKEHLQEVFQNKNITDVDLDSYMQDIYDELENMIDENYNSMVDEVKKYAPESVYEKIDEFKKSNDRSIDLILKLAEQYNAAVEIENIFKHIKFPNIIKQTNEFLENLCISLLNIYKEKNKIIFDVEKSKTVLKDIDKLKENMEIIPTAIDAYPLSIVEDSNVLLKVLNNFDLHDEMIKLIKFLHVQKMCFKDIAEEMKNSFYNDNLEVHKEKYKNIFYTSLKYREEIAKIGTMETIDEVYTEIYNEIVSKIVTIEDLILAEKRISYVSGILNKSREEVILRLLKRIEVVAINDYKEKKSDVTIVDKKKICFILAIYTIVLVGLIFFNNQGLWDKVIWVYIYLFFGFIALVWYINLVRESFNRYLEVYNNFDNIHKKIEKYKDRIISDVIDDNQKKILKHEFCGKNRDFAEIEREYKMNSQFPLFEFEKKLGMIKNEKGNSAVPIIIITLFLFWIVLIICNGIFA